MGVMFAGVATAVHVRAGIFTSLRKLHCLNIHSVCVCVCVYMCVCKKPAARKYMQLMYTCMCVRVCVLGGRVALILGKEKQTCSMD